LREERRYSVPFSLRKQKLNCVRVLFRGERERESVLKPNFISAVFVFIVVGTPSHSVLLFFFS